MSDSYTKKLAEYAVNSFAWVKTHEVYNPVDMVDAQFQIIETIYRFETLEDISAFMSLLQGDYSDHSSKQEGG